MRVLVQFRAHGRRNIVAGGKNWTLLDQGLVGESGGIDDFDLIGFAVDFTEQIVRT